MHNNFFNPGSVTISAGGNVTWTWIGQNHNVTSVLSPSFGGSATENAPFTFGPVVFPAAGTFQYICTIHGGVSGGQTNGMSGAVVVQ